MLDRDSVLAPETTEGELSDSQIDEMLHAAPLPEGLLPRLHRRFDEET